MKQKYERDLAVRVDMLGMHGPPLAYANPHPMCA